jgi:carboxymethylenebutenolidase
MADGTSNRTESIDVEGDSYDAYVALPASGSGPGILLLQEIFGVNDFITQKAHDLARLGYVVLCPDVFWRIQRRVALPHDQASLEEAFGLAGRYSAEVGMETKVADLVAALSRLRGLPEVQGHQTGVMGYCLGGLLAYLVAAHGDPDACVSYYGSTIADLLDLAPAITCPVLFHFGGNDPYIPIEQVDKIATAFSGRDDVTIRLEPDAGHAFENLLAPQFGMPEPAARSWEATVEWLGAHLR